MYQPAMLYRSRDMNLSLCIAIMNQLYKHDGACEHFGCSNESHALQAVVLETNSPVQRVSLNHVCSTQLLRKMQEDSCHFNIITDYVLTVKFDPNLISAEAVKAVVDLTMARQLNTSFQLSICHETTDEIAYLVELTITRELVAQCDMLVGLGTLQHYPQLPWPMTFSIPDWVLSKTPSALRERWRFLVQSYGYCLQQIPQERIPTTVQPKLAEFKLSIPTLFELRHDNRHALAIALDYLLYESDTPLNDFLDQRFPSLIQQKNMMWDSDGVKSWLDKLESCVFVWDTVKCFVKEGEYARLNPDLNDDLVRGSKLQYSDPDPMAPVGGESSVCFEKSFRITHATPVDMPGIFQQIRKLAKTLPANIRVRGLYSQNLSKHPDSGAATTDVILQMVVPDTMLWEGTKEVTVEPMVNAKFAEVRSYINSIADAFAQEHASLRQLGQLSPLEMKVRDEVNSRVAFIKQELNELWTTLAQHSTGNFKAQYYGLPAGGTRAFPVTMT